MNFNPKAMFKLRSAWAVFRINHPDLIPFLTGVVNKGIKKDTQLELRVHYPDGTDKNIGIQLLQTDIRLLEALLETFQ